MKERGILFSAPMVRAILAGKKTMTRRIVNMEPLRIRLPRDVRGDGPFSGAIAPAGVHHGMIHAAGAVAVFLRDGLKLGVKPGEFHFVCPFADGDTHLADHGNGRKRWTITPSASRLWVRETFALGAACDDPDPDYPDDWSVVYRADGDERPWLTSHAEDAEEIPAPWKPSIFMPRWASRITLDVKAVRVERLCDISEEDAIAEGIDTSVVDPSPRGMTVKPKHYLSARECFADLWREINGSESWDANPWVWVVSFEMLGVARG